LPALKVAYMIDEYEKKKRKQIASMRALLDYGLGTLITGFGIFLFIRSKLDISFNENFPPNNIDKMFGALCVIYGGWRIYRGYKKNYFR
jgi:hypothetical protein